MLIVAECDAEWNLTGNFTQCWNPLDAGYGEAYCTFSTEDGFWAAYNAQQKEQEKQNG